MRAVDETKPARPRRARRWPLLLRWVLRIAAGAVLALGLLVALYGVIHPPSTLMLGRWLTFQPVDRRWMPLDAISPRLPAAVLMSEDSQYCLHHGVDWGVLREVVLESEDGPSRGASTITMQVAKNLFLWPSRSYVRKGLEIPLALILNVAWSKRRILEVYLNIAEWGPGVFGAEAASQTSFGKSASALGLREASLLASALPNPLRRQAGRPSRGHLRLAAVVAARMGEAENWMGCLKPR